MGAKDSFITLQRCERNLVLRQPFDSWSGQSSSLAVSRVRWDCPVCQDSPSRRRAVCI